MLTIERKQINRKLSLKKWRNREIIIFQNHHFHSSLFGFFVILFNVLCFSNCIQWQTKLSVCDDFIFSNFYYFFILNRFFKIITKFYKIILKALQNSNFSHIGILGPPGPRKPQVGNSTPIFIFDISKWLVLEIVCIFFLSIHWFIILLISASFLILSDISGLLQGSLFIIWFWIQFLSCWN